MPIKNNDTNITKQTINILIVLLYNSRLCSQNYVLNLINFMNFFVTFTAVYMFFMLSIPNYRENHETRFKITEYLITTYYIIEISIRYFLYTFYDITTYNRIDEFYSEKESFLNLSERQYRIITIKEYKNKSDKEIKKKKKNFVHLIRFFFNKMEIICVLSN